jgi:hypothetical protein
MLNINISFYNKSLLKLLIRSIPIFYLLGLSLWVSQTYAPQQVFEYEFKIRVLGVGIAITSFPFFNSFLFGYQTEKLKSIHNIYILLLSVLLLLVFFLVPDYKLIGFSIIIAYLIRIIIVLRSTSINRSMNYLEIFIFYFSLVSFYPLFLLKNFPTLILFLVVLLLLLIYFFAQKNVVSKKFENKNSKNNSLAINSLSGIILNNFDLVISKLIFNDSVLGLAFLYSTRFVNVLDLITQTFIQSYTLDELKKMKYFFLKIMPFSLVIILIAHPLLLRFFIDSYTPNFWIFIFILVIGLRSLTAFFERFIFHGKMLRFYSSYVFFSALIIIFLLFINKDWEFKLSIYLPILLSIIVVRYFLYVKTNKND